MVASSHFIVDGARLVMRVGEHKDDMDMDMDMDTFIPHILYAYTTRLNS